MLHDRRQRAPECGELLAVEESVLCVECLGFRDLRRTGAPYASW
jgi:hypothetical protein